MIIGYDRLPEVSGSRQEQTIAVRFGCFDLLHPGHIEGIEFASKQADLLVIGVSPDERVCRRKGPDRPIQRQETRLEKVDEIDAVDYSFVVPDGPISVLRSLVALRPDRFVESAEYKNSRHGAALLLRRLGIEYVQDTTPRRHSTTAIIDNHRLTD
jgi:cytidyltransferase-like protein